MTNTKDYRSDKNGAGFSSTEERRQQLKDDMTRMIEIVEENSKPTKRWYEYLGVKPVRQKFMFDIEGRPIFTEQELAERRAFLDGFEAGRTDGDPGPAYKLWHKMQEHSDK